MTAGPDPMAPGRFDLGAETAASSLDELMATVGREIDRTWRSQPGAGEPAATTEEEAGEPSVQFSCAGRRWAVPTRAIVEIRELPPLSAVPFPPPWLRGVARAGGEVVAVVDLERFLAPPDPAAAPDAEPGRETLVVVRSSDRETSAGLAIRGKARLAALAGGRQPAAGGAALPPRLQAVTASVLGGAGGESVAVLDVDRLLRTARAELG